MPRDALLEAMIDKLPEAGKPWPQADREVWFNLMRGVCDVVYGRDGSPAAKPAPIELPQIPLVGGGAPVGEGLNGKSWGAGALVDGDGVAS